MLTNEEWNALTPEEQAERQDEKPEDVGKKDDRDFRNVAAEERRKREAAERKNEELEGRLNEISSKLDTLSSPSNVPKPDHFTTIVQKAEQEMSSTGRTMPVETIVSMINAGSSYYANQVYQSSIKANSIRKKAKRELRSKYKDFSKYEDEFDDYADTLNPASVSEDGLKIIFNSIRGSHLDDEIKEAEERGRISANTKIIGPDATGGGGASTSKTSKLTPRQQEEMLTYGIASEEDYLVKLEAKKERAKQKGSKRVPVLLSDSIYD